ncbi:hypothetical protein TWF506_008197 [Arthrobotrys conoides]|uniref:Uncharacterized protein n=1 Tax=Arthrobotrys conoides TaxID=74498 RepID=A0AAN8N8Y7_9PEZI
MKGRTKKIKEQKNLKKTGQRLGPRLVSKKHTQSRDRDQPRPYKRLGFEKPIWVYLSKAQAAAGPKETHSNIWGQLQPLKKEGVETPYGSAYQKPRAAVSLVEEPNKHENNCGP